MNKVPNAAARSASGIPTPIPTPITVVAAFGKSLAHVGVLAAAELVFDGADDADEEVIDEVDVDLPAIPLTFPKATVNNSPCAVARHIVVGSDPHQFWNLVLGSPTVVVPL
ncbi:hypothetical protein Vi05172_g12611 [Venturia inaequalis]|nr:hypothetical protein Vi05172_g12611 [Venturia inaequalis]